VLILEVTRTPNALRAGSTRETFERALGLVADILRRGQAKGEVRPDLDPAIAAASLLGALELAVSGMVIGLVPAGSEEQIDRVKRHATELVLGGLRP
jgi:TetR/AcrR family fatty acid metabolism transcriptional regulator